MRHLLQRLVQRPPAVVQQAGSRWTLATLRQAVHAQLHVWQTVSKGTVAKWLRRWGIRYKRGRTYVHSPDPQYEAKLAAIDQALTEARHRPDAVVVLYEDEVTYYRRPSVNRAWALAGQDAPRADGGYGSNTKRRVAAVQRPDGREFFSWQRSRFDRFTFARFLQAVAQRYPNAERVVVVVDNWPVHFHADVQRNLAATCVQLLPLPTYAPWTNPVEKVWLALYRQVLHLHRWTDDWLTLQQRVEAWLDERTITSSIC